MTFEGLLAYLDESPSGDASRRRAQLALRVGKAVAGATALHIVYGVRQRSAAAFR